MPHLHKSGWRRRQPASVAQVISAVTAAGCALVLILCLPSSTFAQAPTPKTDTRVYLFRGFMNVFSLGMDSLAHELTRLGIPATVHNHLAWSSAADEAAQNYKLGRARTIMAVCQSIGANDLAVFVERIGHLGFSVSVASV